MVNYVNSVFVSEMSIVYCIAFASVSLMYSMHCVTNVHHWMVSNICKCLCHKRRLIAAWSMRQQVDWLICTKCSFYKRNSTILLHPNTLSFFSFLVFALRIVCFLNHLYVIYFYTEYVILCPKSYEKEQPTYS